MDQMRDLGCCGAGFEPFLDFEIDVDCTRTRHRERPANVIKEDLGQPPVT